MSPVVVCLITFILAMDVQLVLGDSVEQIQKDYWAWRMEIEPEYATYLGYYEYNDRLYSYNITNFEVKKNKMQYFLDRLSTLNMDQQPMSPAKVNYLILKDTLETYIDGYKWAWYGALNPMNFLEGIQIYYSASMTRSSTRGDFENYIARLHKVVQQLDEIEELMREAVVMNRTYHNVSIAAVPGQIDQLLVDNTEDSYFYRPFGQRLGNATSIPQSEKQGIRERGKDAVDAVLQAYNKTKHFIIEEYMPNTRKELGVGGLYNGGEYYKACLKWHLSYEMDPVDVHQKGLEEVARIYGEMTKIIAKLGHRGTVKEFFASLVNNPEFYTNDSDKILQEYNDVVFNRINPKLPQYFKDIPDVPLVIRRMTYDGPGGGYSSASEDSPGVFSINLMRPMENPSFDFMALSLHEANPGHHLQHSYAMMTSLPDYRRYTPISFYDVPFWFPFYSAYSEGWALYSEYLGVEMGLYETDYEMMGRYSAEILRACRLVVDTGLHYYGWERDRAVEYMLNYTAYSKEATEIEVDRYVTWPGQACAYKLGEIKIKELRQIAEKELGNRFDIKDFHSVILTNGAMPMSVLESLIDDWIKEKQTEPLSGTSTVLVSTSLYIFLVFRHIIC